MSFSPSRFRPCLLQRELEQRQPAFLQSDVVENPVDELRRRERQSRRPGRRLDRGAQVVAAHRRDVDLLLRQQRREQRIADERIVEVRPHRHHDVRPRSGAGRRRDQEFDESLDVGRMLLEALLVLGRRRHGVKLLPLIDIDQQAVRLLGRGVEAAFDDAREHLDVAAAKEARLLLRAMRRSRTAPAFSGGVPNASASARSGDLPGRSVTTSHIVVRPCLRSAGMSPANTSDDLPLPDGPTTATKLCACTRADKFADRVIAAAEERRVLFAERLKAPVGADRRADGGGGDRLAAQRGAEIGEAFASARRTLGPLLRSTQVRSCRNPVGGESQPGISTGITGNVWSPVCRTARARAHIAGCCRSRARRPGWRRPWSGRSRLRAPGPSAGPERSSLRSKKVLIPCALSQPFSSAAASPSLRA